MTVHQRICDRQGQELINREEEFETNFDMGYGISGRIPQPVAQSDPSHPKWSFSRSGQVSGGVSLYFMAFVEALCLGTKMFQDVSRAADAAEISWNFPALGGFRRRLVSLCVGQKHKICSGLDSCIRMVRLSEIISGHLPSRNPQL